MPLEDTDIVLLDWWKNHEYRFPKLAKMAKQYLAAPASTAGVERVFSAAGRMHNDLRKSMKDSTLEHSLFARFNDPLSTRSFGFGLLWGVGRVAWSVDVVNRLARAGYGFKFN